MTKRNPHFSKLRANYLFPEINQRKKSFLAAHPDAKVISLGIGDTTEPIPPSISHAFAEESTLLGTRSGYVGYGPEKGIEPLRQKIALTYRGGKVKPDDIIISDGTKCDLGRLQILFGGHVHVAIQDPAYPVYVDGSIMQGITKMTFLPCLPQNHFFPDLNAAQGADLIYFCSPNNPTGATATHAQLAELVAFAKKQKSIIIYDAAYAAFIRDPTLPRSIFEVEGAREVAIEMNSFSKIAGFSGVRLGWTVVPEELCFDDGTPVKNDWTRVMTTIFNGASLISQRGGLECFTPQGRREIDQLVAFYMENARLIKEALESKGLPVYGGQNAPYLWAFFNGKTSWDMFQEFLERLHLVTTPGSGFGQSGEGFLRFTAFGQRDNILEAVERIKKF